VPRKKHKIVAPPWRSEEGPQEVRCARRASRASGVRLGGRSSAARAKPPNTNSQINPSRFAPNSPVRKATPVRLPPGRLKLAQGDRSSASRKEANPCLSGQCQLPSCQHRAGLAKRAAPKIRAALHPSLLSPSRSDRTMLGSHAPTHDPQPGLQNVPAIQESNFEIPETHNSQELEPPLRSNHRQLPRHPPRQISGRRLAAV
jgi:hypothetical protein